MLNLMSAFPLSPRGESDLPLPVDDRAGSGDSVPSFDQCLAESCGEDPFSSAGEDPQIPADQPSLPASEDPEKDPAWETLSFLGIAEDTLPPEDVLAEPNLTDLAMRMGEPEEPSGTEWMDLPPTVEVPREEAGADPSSLAPAEDEPTSATGPVLSDISAPEMVASADPLPLGTSPQTDPPESVPPALDLASEGVAHPQSHAGTAVNSPQSAPSPQATSLPPLPVPAVSEPPAQGLSPETVESGNPALEVPPPPTVSTIGTDDSGSRDWSSFGDAQAPEQSLPAPGHESANAPTDAAQPSGTDPVPFAAAPLPPARSEAQGETTEPPPPGSENSQAVGELPLAGEAANDHSGKEESRSFQSGTSRTADLASLAQPLTGPASASPSPAPAAAASPAPAAGPLTNFMTPATLLEQLDRVVLQSVRADPRSIRIDLEPASLGHVTLHCRETSAGLAVEITVQNPEVRSLLAAQEQELRLGLESQGLQLGRFSVSCRDGEGRPDADQAGQQRNFGGSEEPSRRTTSEAASVEAPATGRTTGSGIRNRWVA